MKYQDGQSVMLGDVVAVELSDGMHHARVVLLGDTGYYAGIDDETAKWAIESGHVQRDGIMAEWIDKNPFEHNDPRYAPVSNTISTDLCGVLLIRRENGSQQPAPVDAKPRA